MTGEPYAAGGIRTTVAATRTAPDEQLAANVARLRRRDARAGHHDRGDQERLRPHGARRGARSLAVARGVHRRDHVPRRARRPRRRRDAAALRRPGDRADAGGVRAVRPMGRRVLRARAPSARTRPAPCSRPASPAGLLPRMHANQLGPGPACGWRSSSALPRPTTARTSVDADVDALAGSRRPWRRCCPASSSRPAALSRRPPPARRRRHGLARDRLQPRQLLHVVDAVLHRRRRARDGHEPAEALWSATTGGARVAAPRRRRPSRRRCAGRLRGARRPVVRAPRLPPRRPLIAAVS